MNRFAALFAFFTFFLTAGFANAQNNPGQHTAPANAFSTGEVRKIDKDAAKITIEHGPLVNLNMPAMTMAFRVQDPAMLEQVKSGDKISFVVERVNGAITVTTLEMAK